MRAIAEYRFFASLLIRRLVFGQLGRKPGGTFHLWLPLAALAAIALSRSIAASPTTEVRRILILNEVGTSYPAILLINQGIQAALNDSPYHLEFYSEYMDTTLFPEPAVQQEFRDFYLHKYQNRRLDVIITVGPSPLKFMQEVHRRAFPGVPIVFCLPIGSVPGAPTLDSDFTGVENDSAPAETVEIGLRLQPGTEHVVVVGGVSEFDKRQQAYIRQQLKELADHLDITYMTDLAVPELLDRLRHLPPHTLVLLTSMAQDAAGSSFKSSEIGPIVTAAANAPVFSLYDVYLNHGEVGGYLSTLSEQGTLAGGMALRILRGEKAQDIARVKGANAYMFDWRAIQRWGLKERELPPASIVINRQHTVWEAYKRYIISGIAVMLAESLLIFGLLWQRGRRKKGEVQLRESEERFRLVANTAPVMIWMSGPDKLCNYFNRPWLEFTGRPIEAELGNGWSEGVHPEDLKDCLDTYTRAFDRRESFRMQYRLRRQDGEYRWLFDIGVPRVASDGSFAGYIGSCIDVTDRKLAEQAMTEIRRKLIEAQEQERMRIGRELHDDITQRLALLAVELAQLEYDPADVQSRIGKLQKETTEISDDVQALSHDLHSSKLEYLGVVAGIRSWCKEFAERQNMEIDFESDVAAVLPFEIGVCLLRVLQEAVHNTAKHGGVKRIEVRLLEQSNQVHLIVSDSGKGFDVESAMQGKGLGLTSMRERVRLVDGTIAIESKPRGGTTIAVRVPLESPRDSQGATQLTG